MIRLILVFCLGLGLGYEAGHEAGYGEATEHWKVLSNPNNYPPLMRHPLPSGAEPNPNGYPAAMKPVPLYQKGGKQ